MTVLPEKARLYLAEAWFREGWADFVELAGERALSLTHEHALILFKPDAIVARAIGPALEHLEEAGFAPVAAAPVEWNRHLTRALWLYRFNVASIERMARSASTGRGRSCSASKQQTRSYEAAGASAASRTAKCRRSDSPSAAALSVASLIDASSRS